MQIQLKKNNRYFTLRLVILLCIGVYLFNSINMFYGTYFHRTALRAPDKPILFFIIDWSLSCIVILGILKSGYTKQTWTYTLFASLAIFQLSILQNLFLFYYANTIEIVLPFVIALTSFFLITRKDVLIRNQIPFNRRILFRYLVLSFLFTIIIYFIIS